MEVSTNELWEKFNGPLRQYICKRIANTDDADDILQEVFYKVHTGLNKVKDADRIPAWIYQITRNTIVDYYRKRKGLLGSYNTNIDISLNDSNRTEAMPCLKQMVESLPLKYRQAVRLVYLEDLTQKEMANRLGLSVSGAKSRVQRARKKLKDMLLECCNFEWDNAGNIIEYQRKK